MEPTLDSVMSQAIADAVPFMLMFLGLIAAWKGWEIGKRLLSLDDPWYDTYLDALPYSKESPEEAALRHKKTLHKSQHDDWTASFKALLPPEPVRCPHCSGPKRSSSRRIASM